MTYAATRPSGQARNELTKAQRRPTNRRMTLGYLIRARAVIALVAAGACTGGCVNITAPDKPIVINLNINITQQIVYKLDGQAKELIQGNPDIF